MGGFLGVGWLRPAVSVWVLGGRGINVGWTMVECVDMGLYLGLRNGER